MFRENVLIALTILITILALSFIILMTVYLQLHEMEQRMKRFEKRQEQMLQQPDWQEQQRLAFSENSGFWRDMALQNQEAYERQNEEKDYIKFTTTTTTESPPTYFGFPDSHHTEPAGAIRFPYHFYGDSGHLTIEVPDNPTLDSSINLENEKTMLEVMKRLYEHYTRNRQVENEARERFFNGIRAYPLGYFYPYNAKHDRYIWFSRKVLQELAPTTKNPKTTTNSASIGVSAPENKDAGPRRNRRKRRTIVAKFA